MRELVATQDGYLTTRYVESRPAFRTIYIQNRCYRIAVPYCVFCVEQFEMCGKVNYYDLRVFFRPEPLRHMTDGLWACRLPNVQVEDGYACLPIASESADPHRVVENVVSAFWQTKFTHHHFSPYDMEFLGGKGRLGVREYMELWVNRTSRGEGFVFSRTPSITFAEAISWNSGKVIFSSIDRLAIGDRT